MNKVMLIGNVGKEPEVKYIDRGVCVASLVLATTERGYKLQNGTEVPERTEWHNIVLWRGLAQLRRPQRHQTLRHGDLGRIARDADTED